MSSALDRRAPCGACEELLPAEASTCPRCGSPVFPATVRVVTMLAVDLAGYTAYSSSRDPEDVHLSVRPLMNRLRLVCEQHGAVVPVIEGDGFLAVFGALEGRPDDPQRALLAAVRLQQLVRKHSSTVAEGFPSLRAGLHVGDAVVAPSWERGGFSVAGDAVNVVSRLCAAAPPGRILGSSELASLAPHEAWGTPQQAELRNRPEPVEVRELGWLELEVDHPVASPLSATPFVERPEVTFVLAALHEGQDVLLVGEAGVGKSRLAAEAVGRFGADVVPRLECARDDFDTRAIAALAGTVLSGVRDKGVQVPAVVSRRLRVLAGEPVETAERDGREELLDAVVTACSALAQEARVLLLVEDLDAAQQEERALLAKLSRTDGLRLRMLLTSREPDVLFARSVDVGALEPALAERLVGHLLPGAEEPVVAALVDRTGGVPLALEQYARILLEDGTVVQEGARCRLRDPEGLRRLPAGMRLFVNSRLDRLDPDARAVVAAAALVGSGAEVDLVRYLAGVGSAFDGALEELVRRGFLTLQANGAEHPDRLAFAHQVVRDVTYGSQLRQQRVAQHLAAAHWYSVLPLVQFASEEARHLEAAVSLGSSDCEVVRQAVQAIVRYAEALVEDRPALAEDAVGRAERIVADHPRCEVDTLRLRLLKAGVQTVRMQEQDAVLLAEGCLDEALERGLADVVTEASVIAGTALALTDPERARTHFDRAEELLADERDRVGLARLETFRAELADVLLGERLAIMERAHREAVRAGDMRLSSLTARELAMYSAARSPAVSDRWSETVRGLVRRDDVLVRAQLDWAAAYRHHARQERRLAVEALRRARESASEAASQQLLVNCELLLLTCLAEAGELEEAEALHGRLIALAEGRPTPRLRVDATLPVVLLASRQGRHAEAQALLDDLSPLSAALGPHYQAEWFEVAARHAQESGDFATASRLASEAARRYHDLGLEAFALRPECIDLLARSAAGLHIGLSEVAGARDRARRLGSAFALAALGLSRQLGDLLTGSRDNDLELFEDVEDVEVRAWALEVRALWGQQPDLLLDAAQEWAQLGTTIWRARALLWHSELTGAEHPEADRLLEVLQPPAGLGDQLRGQVRALKG